MNPRKSTSTNKTKKRLPQTVLKLIEETFVEAFPTELKNKKIWAEGTLYKDELLLRVGFSEPKGVMSINFECSLDYTENNVMQQIHLAVDALDSMMTEYFEVEGDIEFPKEWHEFPFEDSKIFLKTSPDNPILEAEANALLGAAGEIVEEEPEAPLTEEMVDQLFAALRATKIPRRPGGPLH